MRIAIFEEFGRHSQLVRFETGRIEELMAMTAVRAESLTVGYGGTIAVADVSIAFEIGEVSGLAGASGSGKSTLARALAGVLGPEASVIGGEVRQMVRIGFVPQEPVLWLSPYLQVGGQVLDHVSGGHKESPMDFVMETFLHLGLKDPAKIYNSYPHELSGGQLQRVAWAQTLVEEPKFIIADEPTTALDSILQRDILQMVLEQVRNKQAGILWVSHDMNLLQALGGRLLVLEGGAIVEDDAAVQRHLEAWQ